MFGSKWAIVALLLISIAIYSCGDDGDDAQGDDGAGDTDSDTDSDTDMDTDSDTDSDTDTDSDSDTDTDTDTDMDCEVEITFPDENLDEHIREILGVSSDHVITSDDVESVTEVSAEEMGISDLTGMQCLTSSRPETWKSLKIQ